MLSRTDRNTKEGRQRRQSFVAVSRPDLHQSRHKPVVFRSVAYTINNTHMIVTKKWLIVQRLATCIANGKAELARRWHENLMAKCPQAVGVWTILRLDRQRIDAAVRCSGQ